MGIHVCLPCFYAYEEMKPIMSDLGQTNQKTQKTQYPLSPYTAWSSEITSDPPMTLQYHTKKNKRKNKTTNNFIKICDVFEREREAINLFDDWE